MRKLVILATIVAAVGWAEAATYYVDSEIGQDDPSRNGGPGDPWQTITYALSRVSGENTFTCKGLFEEKITVQNDDGGSTFNTVAQAEVKGEFATEGCLYPVFLKNFGITGKTSVIDRSYLSVTECSFSNPGRWALVSSGQTPTLLVRDSVITNARVAVESMENERGGIYLYGTYVADCIEGVKIHIFVSWGISGCRLERVGGTALNIYNAGGSVENTEFYDNGKALAVDYRQSPDAHAYVRDCVFRGNDVAVTVWVKPRPDTRITLERNDVRNNPNNGLELSGAGVYAIGNVVKDNGVGVYIVEGAPDLGTPKNPGGNTFAGSKSGYDVYNASSENIPAYGNTWDPQSEQEMEGKTWQEVNVTRIYDHWDDPTVGYVMWSEPVVGVAPASLGKIKASYKDVPASGQAGPRSAAEVR